LIYYRDPLLERICDRILGLQTPAFIKNSALVFVAVNDAFASLFNCLPGDLVGTKGESVDTTLLLDVEDKERACLVFGEDQKATFADPFGKGRFRVEMERFTLGDGQTFLYCLFGNVPAGEAPELRPVVMAPVVTDSGQATSPASLAVGDEIEDLIGSMDVGFCIWSADNRLTYYNDKLADMFRGVVDRFWVGMHLIDVAEQSFASAARQSPGDYPDSADGRRRWIDERLTHYGQASSAVFQKLSNGVWIKNFNCRLADGGMIGLRIDVSEMKERELLLEQHVEEVGLYRELLNRLPVAAFARGPDRKLAVINQNYADLFGRSIEDLIGTNEQQLLGEHAAGVEEANRDTLANGTEYEEEQETPVADGRIASTFVKTGRMVTEKGVPYIVGTVVDITAIRQRERLLREANAAAEAIRQDFENIISGIDMGIIVLDTDLNMLLVNETYRERIWGASAKTWTGEMVGRPFVDLLRNNFLAGKQPADSGGLEAYTLSRMDEIRSGNIRTREVAFDDGTVTLYSGIKLTGGKFVLCFVDVTELRKRDRQVAEAQTMAERAHRLMYNATETMPEGLMVIEGETIVFANPSLATILNLPAQLLQSGNRWEDVFRATSLQNKNNDECTIADGVSRFREAMATHKDVSYNFPLNDERWVHLDMRARDDGQCIILCSDQTSTMRREGELKRLIARAEAADRAKSEFLGNMSLEIRTPMNGILGMVELLGKSPLDTRQKAFLDIIMKSGHALLTIINDILDFSKLDAGHMQLKYAPFDPGEALEDVASLFAAKTAEKDVELLVKRSGNVPDMIMGDAGRFRQIITNLLANAVKFTDQGMISASIGISSDGLSQTLLTVEVEDSGVGIPSEKLKTIFEKFSQMETASNRREGSGLGLAIAQRLAAIQGGVITVHSVEGRGSVFTFTLPVQVAAEHSKPKPLPANVENARILFVDDHDMARVHLLEHAAEWGFECAGAHDAATGISVLEAAIDDGVAVNVVVIDCEMPEINGAEMVRQLRSNQRFDGLAIILMTSKDIGACEKLLNGVHIDAFLTKPIRIPLLRDTLIDVIRAGATRRSLIALAGSQDNLQQDADVLERELPMPDDEAMPARPQNSLDPNKPYVLVAEDNEVNQIFFSQILGSAGIAYQIVTDGEAAVQAWQRMTPAVILMDTQMPGMDGFAATQMIRAIEAMTGEHTPIIGVVSHVHEGDAAACAAAGMDDHVAKPILPERLEEKILHWAPNSFRVIAQSLFFS
jgi:PAS domain S-box-containing protein